VFKKLLAVILPASTALAVFSGLAPAQAADTPCPASNGRIVNVGVASYTGCVISGNSGAADGGGVSNNGSLTLTNVTITGNSATGTSNGGGIWNNGSMTLTNVTIMGNSAGGDGGGIWNNGSLTMTGVTIGGASGGASNQATSNGGGLWNNGAIGSASTGLTIQNNISGGDGGGIWNDGSAVVTTGTISGNTANNANGGGLRNDGFIDLTGFALSGNTAVHNGGGIYNDGFANVAQSTIGDTNQAGQNGGGVWSDATYRMIQTSLQNNTATGQGGGLFMSNGTAELNSDTISGNHAGSDGGGIYDGSGVIDGTTLDLHPSVAQSRAVKPRADSIVPAPNITISGNISGLNGGGIALTDAQSGSASASFLNATIADNKASGTGGGVWLNSASNLLEIQSALIARNLPQNCKDAGSGQIAEVGGANSANLDTGATCEDGGSHPTDLINVASPKLDVLADNFGFTKTQGLLLGSSAIDAVPAAGGCPTPPPVDERGITRPQSTLCDIGAYECIGIAPNVTQVAPNTGPIAGGTKVTITGTGFDRPATVTFGGAPATNVVINSLTQITATTPAGNTGTAAISVTTCRASGVSAFTFEAPALPAAGASLPSSPMTWAWLLLMLVIGGPAAALLAFAYRPEKG
jgi:IPT/TIG domain